MYSLAKSICALSIHILADRQKLSLEKPVCDYWPEFGAFSKQNIKVRHCISHWCGVWSNENAKPGDIYDSEAMQRAIEKQHPEWGLEQKGAYNTINIGFICGAIVKNVTGKTIQQFIYEEIVEPLRKQSKVKKDIYGSWIVDSANSIELEGNTIEELKTSFNKRFKIAV